MPILTVLSGIFLGAGIGSILYLFVCALATYLYGKERWVVFFSVAVCLALNIGWFLFCLNQQIKFAGGI